MNIFPTIKLTGASKAFLIYAISFGIAGITPFVLLPILTNNLSPKDFGVATSFIISSTMAANILGFSAYGLLSVRFFKEKKRELTSLVTTSLLVFLLNHLIVYIVCLFFFDFIGYFTSLPLAIGSLVLISAFWSCVNLVSLALFQASDRPLLYLILRCIQSSVEIGGCLLLLRFAPDATSRIYSYSAALFVSAAVGVCILYRWGLLTGRPTLARVREVFAFGLPMLPHIASGVIIMNVDRVFVTSLLGPEGLGIFMVAMQLGLALSLFTEPLNKVLAPWLFKQLSDSRTSNKDYVVKVTYQIFIALILFSLCTSTFFYFVFDLLFDKSYGAARGISFYVAIGVSFQGMYYCMVNYMFYAEATATLSRMTAAVASIAVAVSYMLISSLGLVGGAIAFAFNNLLLFVAVWYIANRTVPMPWFGNTQRGG